MSARQRGRRLAQAPCEVAPRLETRILGDLPPRSLPVTALLESLAEPIVCLGQTRIALERGPLLTDRVLHAPREEVDKTEIAPDLRIVGIKRRGGFQFRHGLREATRPIEAEPIPRALGGLGTPHRRGTHLRDVGFALRLSGPAIGLDQQWIEREQPRVLRTRPLEGADRFTRPPRFDQGRAKPAER